MAIQAHAGARDMNSAPAAEFLRGLIEANELAGALNVNRDTLSRMTRNPRLGFPKSFTLGQSTYYNASAVRRWVAEQAGLEG